MKLVKTFLNALLAQYFGEYLSDEGKQAALERMQVASGHYAPPSPMVRMPMWEGR